MKKLAIQSSVLAIGLALMVSGCGDGADDNARGRGPAATSQAAPDVERRVAARIDGTSREAAEEAAIAAQGAETAAREEMPAMPPAPSIAGDTPAVSVPDGRRAPARFNTPQQPETPVQNGASTALAFVHQLGFSLPVAQVQPAQERHIAACEALRRGRCVVTGVQFNQTAEDQVSGQLSLLLDPALAHNFTRDAAAIVADLDGRTDQNIVSGNDVGTQIATSQDASVRLGGDLERIERRLRSGGLSANERSELNAQAESLRQRMTNEAEGRRRGEAQLATTPVTISYRGLEAGALSTDRPFASAWEASGNSFAAATAFTLMLLGISLPWLLLGGAGWLAYRFIRRRKAGDTLAPSGDSGSGVAPA